MKKVWLFLFFLPILVYGAEVKVDHLMDSLIESSDKWELSQTLLSDKYPGIFRSTDQSNNRLRYGYEQPQKLAFLKYLICELVVDFKDGKASEYTIGLYNRGDAGVIKKDFFDQLVKDVNMKLQEYAGDIQPTVEHLTLTGGTQQFIRTWVTPQADYQLRYALSNQSIPEFCMFVIYPSGKAPQNARQALKPKSAYRNLKANIQTDQAGNRFMLLPMVDQGAKGYCVAAVLERIMSYYGAEFDQHTMAQISETSAMYGTNLEKAIDRLDSIKNRLNLRITTFYRFWAFEKGGKDLYEFVLAYNRASAVTGQRPINLDGGMISLDQFQYPTFILARQTDRSARQKFISTIRQSINQGVPLCWAVMLFPDSPENTGAGGHLRIISGLSRDGKTIIYTDTWGAGHEKKFMAADHAFGITMRLFSVAPALK